MNVSRSSTEPLLWSESIACTCDGTLNGRHEMRYRSEVSPAEDTEPVEMSGWRVIALYGFYALLGALAAAVATGTFPHRI